MNIELTSHAATVAPVVHHVVKHVAAPVIFLGVSKMTAIIFSAVALAAGFGLGWYVKGRGMAGVQIDLNNVKTDVENLKAKVFPAPVVVATPVATVAN